MPAIVTHQLFGEDASVLLGDDTLGSQEELMAFLLGNQGPDPLWARFTCSPRTVQSCRDLAQRMHEGDAAQLLCALRTCSEHRLRSADSSLGMAFALGFAAHYLLDSMTHPLILALAYKLEAANPDLLGAQSELHALIESDIDTWMLWQKRQKTIDAAPVSTMLASTTHVDHIAGTLVSIVAKELYGIDIAEGEYGRAVCDYRLAYRLIDPPSKWLRSALIRLESLGRMHSRIEAQTHLVSASDECASANLEHERWRNPFTSEISVSSFADLFHDAILAWPTFSKRLIEGDQRRLTNMIGGLDFYGKPSETS